MFLYRSINGYAEAEYVIEKSRFIAHASPAETPEEARLFVSEIKEKYKDATHNVPAFVCGAGMEHQWQRERSLYMTDFGRSIRETDTMQTHSFCNARSI